MASSIANERSSAQHLATTCFYFVRGRIHEVANNIGMPGLIPSIESYIQENFKAITTIVPHHNWKNPIESHDYKPHAFLGLTLLTTGYAVFRFATVGLFPMCAALFFTKCEQEASHELMKRFTPWMNQHPVHASKIQTIAMSISWFLSFTIYSVATHAVLKELSLFSTILLITDVYIGKCAVEKFRSYFPKP